jgi:threonine/homoserine/homoserine lactone efflux protein
VDVKSTITKRHSMFIIFFLEGCAIGFLLAMPVGPIGVLCVRRTITLGNGNGLIVGLSGASADVIYALVAAFGITLISDFITGFQHWIRLAGGILLLFLGLYIFRSHPSEQTASKRSNKRTKIYLSTFLLALTNPMTLFAYGAVFSGLRGGHINNDRIFLPMLVAGVFFGSLLWFLLLTSLTYILKKNIRSDGLVLVNRVAGCLLMSFGIIAIWTGANRL